MHGEAGYPIRPVGDSVKLLGALDRRAGTVVRAKVDAALGGDRYRIAVGSLRIVVSSKVSLHPGEALRLQITQGRSGNRLRILPSVESSIPDSAAGAQSIVHLTAEAAAPRIRYRQPADAFAEITRALLRAGISATPQAASVVRSMIPPQLSENQEFLRFAAALYDKHLEMSAATAAELFSAVHPREGTGDADTPFGDGRRGGAGSRRSQGLHRGNRTESEAETHARIRSSLGDALRPGAEAEAGTLAVFNHAAGDWQSWVVVPYRIGLDGKREGAFRGTIRLLVDKSAGGRLSVSRAAITVDSANGADFEMWATVEGAPARKARIAVTDPKLRRRALRELPRLAEKLRNLGVQIDDTSNGGRNFDGFSSVDVPPGTLDSTI